MTASSDLRPVFSRSTLVDAVGNGLRINVEANAAEREALAALNKLAAVNNLTGSFLLRQEFGGGVWVTGEVKGSVVQTCVVSLEAFDAEFTEPVDVHFLPEGKLEAYRAERVKSADPNDEENQEDEPDPIIYGRIDLGRLAAEHLTLGLDPYPHKPGVEFKEPAPRDADSDLSPFAALKSLKSDDA